MSIPQPAPGAEAPALPTTPDASAQRPVATTERRVTTEFNMQDPLAAAERIRQVIDGKRQMRVLILSSDTGGGHRASANALRAALHEQHGDRVHVNIVDFFVEFAQGTFKAFPAQYAFLAKHPWMWKLAWELTRFPPIRGAQEVAFNALAHRNVRHGFLKYDPDLIVSVHPLVNTLSMRVLRIMRDVTRMPSPPFVTVVTDLVDTHPTWYSPRVDMVYVPSEKAKRIATRCRVIPERIRLYGLPVRKDFWTPPKLTKVEMRANLGMHPDLTAFMLIGGGDGVGSLGDFAKAIAAKIKVDHGRDRAQLVVVCGKNTALREELLAHDFDMPVIVKGYVSNISDLMLACDVLCTKAGPGTLAEGLIRGMPILITAFLPGQEEGNVHYIVENGAGEYSPRPPRIAAIASRWLGDEEKLAELSRRAAALGTPDATLKITDDIWSVANDRLTKNAATLEHIQRTRDAQAALVRAHLQSSVSMAGNMSLVPHSRESHLLSRMRVLMRVIFGTVFVSEALSHARIAN